MSKPAAPPETPDRHAVWESHWPPKPPENLIGQTQVLQSMRHEYRDQFQLDHAIHDFERKLTEPG